MNRYKFFEVKTEDMDIELKEDLISKIVSEEIKLNMRDEEIKVLGELIKHQQNKWNELKGWLKANDIHYAEAIPFRETLKKMEELEKESDVK